MRFQRYQQNRHGRSALPADRWRKRGVIVAVSAMVTLGMAGCAGAGSVSTASATGSPIRSSSASRDGDLPSSVTLPPGHRWRTIEKVHTTFAAPETWTAIDATKLSAASGNSPELKEIADRMGVTVQQFKQAFANVELFLAGPPVDGFAPNLNALVLPVAEMPSDAALQSEVGRLASAPPTLRHISTPVGEAVDMAYPVETGGRTVHVHSLILNTPDGVLDLTISAPDQATASSLTGKVLESVHRT